MRLETDTKLDYKDVLIVPKRSTLTSRNDVSLVRDFTTKHSNIEWSGIPIIAANMDTVGTMSMARALHKHGISTALHKFYTVDELINFYNEPDMVATAFYTMGITENDKAKYDEVKSRLGGRSPLLVCIDVANGYTEKFVDFIKRFREENPYVFLMAGNVCTPEMTEQLVLSGVDLVKGGIGGGAHCTTRRLTGIGYPQLSMTIECADAAHGLGGLLCSDGGIEVIGDISKSFCAGADFVMIGSMFSAHTECEGEIITKTFLTNEIDTSKLVPEHKYETKKYMKCYGMSSEEAMLKHYGKVATHRASEGKSSLVEYRGDVSNTALEMLGGIRSTMTYIGAKRLKEMSKRATFIRVNNQINNSYSEITKKRY